MAEPLTAVFLFLIVTAGAERKSSACYPNGDSGAAHLVTWIWVQHAMKSKLFIKMFECF